MNKIIQITIGFVVVMSLTNCTNDGSTPAQEKPRIIVTADPELDDNNSMIRFLLHATDFRIEGLIYASSQFHWKGDGQGTLWFVPGREYTRSGLNFGPLESWRWAENERFIHDIVDAYEASYANLKVHRPDYPTPEYLQSIIRYGNIEFDGDISKDSPGSELIKEKIMDDVPGPLFITAWGGGSTIARALLVIENEYKNTPQWASIKEKVSNKVILCLSGDQDDTYAKYIQPNWPDIGRYQAGGGGVGLAYNAQASVKPEFAYYYQPEWVQANITNVGPLGALFRVWGDGKQMVEGDIFDYFHLSGYTSEELREMGYVVWTPPHPKGSWLGEGDTGTFLNLVDNGLRAHENETWGSWAGRRRQTPAGMGGMPSGGSGAPSGGFGMPPGGFGEIPGGDGIPPDIASMMSFFLSPDTAMPLEFLPAAQNELAARFKWAVTPRFEDANHHPVITGASEISAKASEKVALKMKVIDPDKDVVSLQWVQFKVGTYEGDVSVENPATASTSFTVPSDAKPGDTIHLVLEAKDSGSPALYRYHRVIITVI